MIAVERLLFFLFFKLLLNSKYLSHTGKFILISFYLIINRHLLQFKVQNSNLHQIKHRMYDVGVYFTSKTNQYIKTIPYSKNDR